MPARALPLWEKIDATLGEDDPQTQPAPECEFDQRIAWQVRAGSRHAQRSRLKRDEPSSPVVGRLVPCKFERLFMRYGLLCQKGSEEGFH